MLEKNEIEKLAARLHYEGYSKPSKAPTDWEGCAPTTKLRYRRRAKYVLTNFLPQIEVFLTKSGALDTAFEQDHNNVLKIIEAFKLFDEEFAEELWDEYHSYADIEGDK